MRLHRNLVLAVIDSLNYIFNDGLYADKVVAKTLKRDTRWGSRDRAFIAETVYDCVRWKRLYNEIAGTKNHFTQENLWKIFTVWATLKGISLPDWKQFEGTPVRRLKGKFDEFQSNRAIRESIPDWLDELGQKEIGKQWDEELEALNQQADAMEAMREGLRQFDEAMANQQAREEGQQGGNSGDSESASNQDPLGRSQTGRGGANQTDNPLGDTDETYRRAEELMQELRKRSGETDRPELERDYLKRLLDQF